MKIIVLHKVILLTKKENNGDINAHPFFEKACATCSRIHYVIYK